MHQPLIGGTEILQPKRHDLITVVGELHHEGDLSLITGVHVDLIVPRERV